MSNEQQQKKQKPMQVECIVYDPKTGFSCKVAVMDAGPSFLFDLVAKHGYEAHAEGAFAYCAANAPVRAGTVTGAHTAELGEPARAVQPAQKKSAGQQCPSCGKNTLFKSRFHAGYYCARREECGYDDRRD